MSPIPTTPTTSSSRNAVGGSLASSEISLPATRFGANIGQFAHQLTPAMDTIASMDRTTQMLVEDFVGFGGLRTFMDLLRGYFYNDKENGPFNIPAARERLLRESLSIITDNVASGVAAYAIGKAIDKRFRTFSNGFAHFNSLEWFRDIAQRTTSEREFLTHLSADLAGESVDHPTSRKILETWQQLSQKGNNPALQERIDAAPGNIARVLDKETFDLDRKGQTITLPELIEDVSAFLKHVKTNRQKSLSWQASATRHLDRTIQVKQWKLACLSIGLLLTFAVPYLIRWITRKLDHEDTYPGERGLIQRRPKLPASDRSLDRPPVFESFISVHQGLRLANPPGKWEKWFPFVAKSFNNGNPVPAVLSALPLLLTVGLFDTVSRRFQNPLAPGFLKYLRNAYDFGKGFPYTTQQQMASMYAFLIASRLSSARSGNEFRERVVDSALSWSLWILGTPAIKRWVSKWMDTKNGTQLVKSNGLRTRAEIEHFVRDGGKTLKSHIWIGSLSTLATIVMLGIVEPYLAILWTKRNAQKNNNKPLGFSGEENSV